LAVRETEAALAALHRLFERDGELRGDVGAGHRHALAAAPAGLRAEHLSQDRLEVEALRALSLAEVEVERHALATAAAAAVAGHGVSVRAVLLGALLVPAELRRV